jgi:hypothetical protein
MHRGSFGGQNGILNQEAIDSKRLKRRLGVVTGSAFFTLLEKQAARKYTLKCP